MHFPTFFGLILAAIDHTAAHSIPKTYVVHEQRDAHLDNPKRMHPDVMIPVRITLKQSNHAIENAHKWLMDVSHPSSDKYGQHWSQKDIVAAFQPSKESVEAVANWLADYGGISRYRQAITSSRSWVTFNATIEEVESLLATEYYRRDSANSALVHCNHYSLPDHVQEHVDFITPGVNGITVEYTTWVTTGCDVLVTTLTSSVGLSGSSNVMLVRHLEPNIPLAR